MKNYMVLDENHIQMPFGILGGIAAFGCYPTGELESVRLTEKNVVMTSAGELVPAYTETMRRKNKPSVEFDRQGLVRSVALETQQEVLSPIGELPAELVKFYNTGEMHRVFVVDGQISGFWTEKDEREKNITLTFDLGFCQFSAMLNGLCFYKSGGIKSITLFPGERITVSTPLGDVDTGIGLSLYESGKLESVEPKEQVIVQTPIGALTAWDPERNGLNADSNSLCFTEDGKIQGLTTCDNEIYVQTAEGAMQVFRPDVKPHPLYDDQFTVEGMKIRFDYSTGAVQIDGEIFGIRECGFTIEPFLQPGAHCTPADCASCSLCNKN